MQRREFTSIEELNKTIQSKYNEAHGITPKTIFREVEERIRLTEEEKPKDKINLKRIPKDEYGLLLKDLKSQMDLAAANLQFEQAAELRDLIKEIESKL